MIFSKLNLYFFNFEIVTGEIYVKFIGKECKNYDGFICIVDYENYRVFICINVVSEKFSNSFIKDNFFNLI